MPVKHLLLYHGHLKNLGRGAEVKGTVSLNKVVLNSATFLSCVSKDVIIRLGTLSLNKVVLNSATFLSCVAKDVIIRLGFSTSSE